MGIFGFNAPAVPTAPPPMTAPTYGASNGPGGLLDLLLGRQNPFAQFVDQRRNVIGALGAGLAAGPDFSQGLAKGAQLVPQARALDDQNWQTQQTKTTTYAWLKSKPELSYLADAMDAGMPAADAYTQALKIEMDTKTKADALAQSQNYAKTIADQYPDIAAALRNGSLSVSDAFKAQMDERKAGAKPPTVQTQFDAQGAEQKMVWDPASGSWKPFGGPKAPAGDPNQDDDVHAIADAIVSGQQPPIMTGMYHLTGPLRAELSKRNYDLTKAQQDFTTTQKLLNTMANPQQTRIRQATGQVAHQLENVKDLASQWKAGGFKPLNSVVRKLAESGSLGQQAQSIITRLDSAINDMTGELANVYMGGNSPTDKAIDLAASNLNTDWSDKTLDDNIAQIEQNLRIRINSLNLATPGFPDSAYNPMTVTTPAALQQPGTPQVPIAGQTPGAAAAPSALAPGEVTATNPATGQRLVFRGGQWVPL